MRIPTVVEIVKQSDDDARHPQGYLHPETHPSVERKTEEIEIPIFAEVAISYRLLAVGYWLSAVGCRLWVIGCGLVADC